MSWALSLALWRVARAGVTGVDVGPTLDRLYSVAHRWLKVAERVDEPDLGLLVGLVMLLGPMSDQHARSEPEPGDPTIELRGRLEALFRKWNAASLN